MRPPLGKEKLRLRDPALRAERFAELRRLYEEEGLTVTQIAARFGASHRSVSKLLVRLGVQMRRPGVAGAVSCCEPDCVLPVYKTLHRTNGCRYGRRCRLHWILFRMSVNQRYHNKTVALGKDESWLRRMRQLLARVKRLNREVSQSLREESPRETTSPGACPR